MKKFIQIFFFVVTGLAVTAQTPDDKKIAARLDSILSAYTNKNMFNGSVLVAKKGKVLLKKGYGSANFSYNIPNKPDTKFKLASVTKQFTAMGIMILEEQGKLSVNDSLSKFIPDYPGGNKITLHHLLNHSSGIPNLTASPRFDSIKVFPHTLEQVIGHFKTMPLEFEPGQKFNYSNSGYILLTSIIEKISGMSYAEFISKNIFEKLEMKNSGYCNTNAVIKNMAEGYNQTGDDYAKAPYVNMSIPLGAGGLYSTVEDLYLWDRALYTEKLVKKNTIEKILTPSKDGMGYGWFINTFQGNKWIFHNGGIEGFSTAINRFPENDICIIMLKNVDNQTYFSANKIARQMLFNAKYELPAERKEIKLDPLVFKKLVGQFELEPGFVFTVTDDDGKLFLQATGQPQFRLFPESEWKYFVKEVNASIEFIKGENGNAASLILFQNGQRLPGKKIQ
jgi:CubicO group peptidase (beta-lactamase class C family)